MRQPDLFESHRQKLVSQSAPLADRMRPRTLDEFIGQDHILGPGRLLRRAIQIDQISSLIFYGPPGTGKTTLARIIANTTKANFIAINAVLAGVKDIREAIDAAQKNLSLYSKRTILFIDEVHRFNKAQQDALLPHVENGVVTLIGATTENPYFEVNKALVSRSRIFQLKQLTLKDLVNIALQALHDKERGFGARTIKIEQDALEHLVKVANGDARGVLNALELAVETTKASSDGVIYIDRSIAEESIQQRAVLYDKDGDAHYDTISAFIKSVRGSDPDAALYWMAKMVYAGEDPRFIFRRMLILASEDIGLADPNALQVVVNAAAAYDYVGLPEGRFHLAQACLYLATAPKSNSTMAFFDALDKVSKEVTEDVPNHLRDASRDKEGFGHGEGYLYPHAYRDHWVAQQYLPDTLQGKLFYQPSDQGYEASVKSRVEKIREAQLEAMVDDQLDSLLTSTNEGKRGERNLWITRTLGSKSTAFGVVREKIFQSVNIPLDGLVLDVNATTGLLTLEALRVASQGTVWALCHDNKAFQTMTGIQKKFDSLQAPQLIKTDRENFLTDLFSTLGEKVKFDAIIGRNFLNPIDDKVGVLQGLSQLLTLEGTVCLSEPVLSQSQRLSQLPMIQGIDKSLLDKFIKCETTIYENKNNPLCNWTLESLSAQVNEFSSSRCKVNLWTDEAKKRIFPEEIHSWFNDRSNTLCKVLRTNLTETELSLLETNFHQKLDFCEVGWKTLYAFIILKKND